MPRKARIDYPGLTHHIMARTFNDLFLFKDEDDRDHYLSLLTHRIKETGFLCFAWALMVNHVHLLIKTNEKPLWRLMKPLNCDYSRWYNTKYNRKGPLFIDRYKSIATQDQNYLEQLIRYIHLNPVRAGICKDLDQLKMYPWSGHSALMGTQSNEFQQIQLVLKRFGKTRKEAIENYERFLKEAINNGREDSLLEIVRSSNNGKKDKLLPECWVIGDHEFQRSVLQKDTANRLTLAEYKKQGLCLEVLLKKVSEKMRVSAELIKLRSKRTKQVAARMVFCYAAMHFGFPTREIGALLGIQQAAVSNAGRKGEQIVRENNIVIV
jgi:REP element-mobilizing transposase RayT